MTPQQAHQLLSQLASVYKGTLQEHQNLQQALEVLKPTESKPKSKAE